MHFCSVDGCERPAKRSGVCWAHAKRKVRGVVVDGALARRYASQWERLTEAALHYADVGDDERAYKLAKDRLRQAALDYAMDEGEQAPRVPTVGMMRHSLVAARRGRVANTAQLTLFP